MDSIYPQLQERIHELEQERDLLREENKRLQHRCHYASCLFIITLQVIMNYGSFPKFGGESHS